MARSTPRFLVHQWNAVTTPSSRTMAYQHSLNVPSQSPMDHYSPPYSPSSYGSSTNPYGHQHFYYPPGRSPIQVDDAQYDPNIHPYWKDRVVPRPGFRSPRALGPTAESNRIVIKDPRTSNETQTKQLLPPRSHNKSNQKKSSKQHKENKGSNSNSPEVQPISVCAGSYIQTYSLLTLCAFIRSKTMV